MLFYANSWSDKLYFEPLEESVAEMETKKEINLRFFDSNAQEVVCIYVCMYVFMCVCML